MSCQKNGARLKSIAFGSHSFNDDERNFHSFTGESACGRCTIAQNRKYLSGCHFYWMCDCSAIKEILEYDGRIPMIYRWTHELIDYQFTLIHHCNKTMIGVDALTKRFEPLIVCHCTIAGIFHSWGRACRPLAYEYSNFHTNVTSKLTPPTTSFPRDTNTIFIFH